MKVKSSESQPDPTKLQPLVLPNGVLPQLSKRTIGIKEELVKAADESALCDKEATRAGLQTIVHLPHGLNLMARALLKFESVGEKLLSNPNIDHEWARLQKMRALSAAVIRHGVWVPPPEGVWDRKGNSYIEDLDD
ncbi:hypothetical protein HDU76_005358 [Blyttiomyces sp. JEL0837]|nr:hypothetical protein HDU76_005358 [Blyttiomyces sp. JEL0837]